MSKIKLLHCKGPEKKDCLEYPNDIDIYYDDTINDIKRKIIMNANLNVTIDEIYLFGRFKNNIHPDDIFDTLIKKSNFFLLENEEIEIIEMNYNKKAKYENERKQHKYVDFKKLFEWENIITETPIGHKIFDKKEYLFITNPYKLIHSENNIRVKNETTFDDYLFNKREDKHLFYNQNNNLLFEFGNQLIDNEIYICLARDYWDIIKDNETIRRKDDMFSYVLQIYFPNLYYNKNITNQKLLSEMAVFNMNDKLRHSYSNIKNFHEHLSQHKGKISSINFTLHSSVRTHIPLDLLFKIVHSNFNIQLAKYNPGKLRENIFRLYTSNYISSNNLKLPSLYVENNNRLTLIKKIDKMLALKPSSLGFFLYFTRDGVNKEIHCEFYSDGSINIKILECFLDKEELIEIIKENVNEFLLKPINKFIKKSGFTFDLFENFEKNIEMKNINYKYEFGLLKSNNFSLNQWSKALRYIYVTNRKNFKKNDKLSFQYIKVSSYKAMDAIKTFILNYKRIESESAVDNTDDRILLELLLTNFPEQLKNKNDAVEEIKKYNEELRLNLSVYSKKKIESADNPGFGVTMYKKFDKTIIEYENVNNYSYLKFLDIYTGYLIDNLLLVKNKERKKILNSFYGAKPLPILDIEQNKNVAEAIAVMEEEQDVLTTGFAEKDDINEQRNVDDADDYEDEDSSSDEEGDDAFGDDDDESSDDEDPFSGGGSDSESESESEDESYGNLNDIQLKGKSNYFIKRIRKNQPEIFTKDTGSNHSYAKFCQTNAGKTPVILTNEEKKKIDKIDEEQGIRSYDEFITEKETGKQYHYICPRFWCFSDKKSTTGRPLSFEQVNQGECGGWDAVIKRGSKRASNDKRIFEFTDAKSHEGIKDNDLVYKQHYPGFQRKNIRTKDGVKEICLPCCYKKATQKYKPMSWEEKDKDKYYDKTNKYWITAPKNFKKIGTNGEKLIPSDYYLKDDKRYETKKLIPFLRKRKDETISVNRQKQSDLCNVKTNYEQAENKTLEQLVRPTIESFPLRRNTFGYLQLSLQKFFNYNITKECWISSKDSRLKPKKWTLLRVGMDDSNNNSFLTCISNIYTQYLLIKEGASNIMKTGEAFNVTNANLISDTDVDRARNIITKNLGFRGMVDYMEAPTDEDIDNFNPSQEEMNKFLSINKGNLYHMFLENKKKFENENDKIKNAMINFVKYIWDEKKKKNSHEIFWEIVTLPKKNGIGAFFDEGVNLIVIKKPKDDIEDKIEVVCPKNNHSKYIFDENKRTIILYMENNIYEPIYMVYRTMGAEWKYMKLFEKNHFAKKDFKNTSFNQVIKTLKNKFDEMCSPKKSLRNYDFIDNTPLNKLLDITEKGEYTISPIKQISPIKKKYNVVKQLYNDQYQVIAIVIKHDKGVFALPCAPSAININISKERYGDNLDYLMDKLETQEILEEFNLYKEANSIVTERNMVVGIRTKTNQVVLINPEPIDGDMDEDGRDEILQEYTKDRMIMLNYPEQDKEREEIIKKIHLESNFYLMFRNLFKIEINKKENEQLKFKIFYTIIDQYKRQIKDKETGDMTKIPMTYKYKMKLMILELTKVLSKHIHWAKISDDVEVDELLSCLDLGEDSCEKNVNCAFKDDSCKIILPEFNLMYGDDKISNERIYYKKLADEILRYKKIREYVLSNDTFMNYESVDYKINDNEIVILSTMLYQMYNDEEDENVSEHLKNYSIYDNTNINDGDIIRYKNMITIENHESPVEEEAVVEVMEEDVEDSGAIEQKIANVPKPKENKPKQSKPKEKKPKTNDKKIKKPGETMAYVVFRYYIKEYFNNMTLANLKKTELYNVWKARYEYVKKWKNKRDKLDYGNAASWDSIEKKKEIEGFAKPPFKDIWENETNIFKNFKVYDEQTDDKLKWIDGVVERYLIPEAKNLIKDKMKYNHLRKPIDHFLTEIMIGKIGKEQLTGDMKLGDVIVKLLKNAESKWVTGKIYCKEDDCDV